MRVGHVGLARLDPDYTDVLVLNQVLGGQFTSRLNAKLREEKGFTYGVRSHFECRRNAGPFFIAASLQADRLAEALEDLHREVEALVGGRSPTASELDDARRALIEGQAHQFETPSALVSRYAILYLHGLPPDYHAQFAERLDGVSVASLAAARAARSTPRRWSPSSSPTPRTSSNPCAASAGPTSRSSPTEHAAGAALVSGTRSPGESIGGSNFGMVPGPCKRYQPPTIPPFPSPMFGVA